jgi:hypothetical protein
MAFKIEAFQNRFLSPGQSRVDAILTVSTSGDVKASGAHLVVAFIIDKSGSMQGERLESVVRAVGQAIALLDERAWFFVVAFDAQAYVVMAESQATEANKKKAVQALGELRASGGTAMSTGLHAARMIFDRAPNSIKQAVFLTDGKNESEQSGKVALELARSEGLFQCDCWGVGTDWRVGEVQQISQMLLGKASLIPDPAGVAAAFKVAIEKASGKALKDVRLRLWTPQGSEVVFVKQVNPTIEDMTAKGKQHATQVREFYTGAWGGGESRDFHVAIEVKAGAVGAEMLACRSSVVYLEPDGGGWVEREEKPAEGRVFASWTQDSVLTSPIDQHVAHYTGQDELADAIKRGLQQREAGDEAGATQLLGRAVKLAHVSRNVEMTQRLARVVEVVDAGNGTVRLKRDVKKAATMDLELESRTTKRVARAQKPAGGGT